MVLRYGEKKWWNNLMKDITANFSNDQVNLSLEEYNELDQSLYDYSFRMKRDIMGNQCFVVLCNEMAYDIYDIINNKAIFWRKLLPVMRIYIYIGYIDMKGKKLLELA